MDLWPNGEIRLGVMTSMTHIKTKELPEVLQSALRAIGYHRPDIAVEGTEKVSLFDAGGEGRRGFSVLLDLTTGDSRKVQGSWGGANMFNPSNVVDLDDREHTLPPNGAVIQGSEGYKGVYASIYLHPSNIAKVLPPKTEISDKDRSILYAYGCLKSGTYRQEELSRIGASQADIDSLVTRGLLKKAINGATSITTEGKNTRTSHAGSGRW